MIHPVVRVAAPRPPASSCLVSAHRTRSRRGRRFTLIELLVVVAIIAWYNRWVDGTVGWTDGHAQMILKFVAAGKDPLAVNYAQEKW